MSPDLPLLRVENLKVYFPVRHGLFRRSREWIRAVDEVNFSISAHETVGLVGESGCGKTTLGRAAVGLVNPVSGKIFFEDQEITSLPSAKLRRLRRKFQIIFQDPYGSLDPRMTIEDSVAEGMDVHGLVETKKARRARVAELLQAVGLDGAHAQRYPHEFSGGQRQRIGIARALAVEPKLIVCDEPVSALDVSVQAQIVNLLQDLRERQGIAYLFIAHDLAVVEHLSRRILVMYLGRIVEHGQAKAVIRQPRHPYTKALISAIPVADPESRHPRIILPGDVPSPIHPPAGCPFHPRCPLSDGKRCREEVPLLREITPGQFAACHYAEKAGVG